MACLALSTIALAAPGCRSGVEAGTLPTTLSDDDFWSLIARLSEPPGSFRHSDNLVSNETEFAQVIRILRPRGGVYIGVGPEQNFSYIARLRPTMAFILDIRQENRNLHLLYKALFELSADRADFLSRLFSRERPAGLDSDTLIQDLFTAFERTSASPSFHESNAGLVRDRLLDHHRFPLSLADLEWVDYALDAFYSDGPGIHYGRSRPGSEAGPSYRSLMTAADLYGNNWSYLASEESFRFVKDLQARNLIVPLVGDFGGPGAIRRVGDYIRQHGASVSAFYASNVEVYLNRQQTAIFCDGLRALPSQPRTWYIRSKGLQTLASKWRSCPPIASNPRR